MLFTAGCPVALVAAPEGALLAVKARGRVRLLDLETGQTAAELPDVVQPDRAAVADIGGTPTLASLDPQELRFFDTRSGRPAAPAVPISSTSTGIAWARLGTRDLLLTAHFATVRVWHPRTGRKLTELPFGTHIGAFAVHRTWDGRLLVAVGGPGAVVVELRDVT